MVNELRRMQRRIDELEAELARVRNENDALAAELHRGELLTVALQEPVLA
jgi:cell division protein FtsB